MTHFTSDQLTALAEEIPTKAIDRGLLFIEDAEFLKSADVQLSAASVSIDNALAIAAAAHAPFVSLQVDKFDPVHVREVLTPDNGDELPAKVKRLISAARSHTGEVDALWLRWPANGLILEWTAVCEWRDALWEGLQSAVDEAERGLNLEAITREYAQKAKISELAAILITSTEFRATPANKRHPVAESIISSATTDDIEPYVVSQASSEAARAVDRKSFEYEGKFQAEVQELARELRRRPDWAKATTVARRREAAQLFLAEKADGYRVGPRIVVPVMEAARAPE